MELDPSANITKRVVRRPAHRAASITLSRPWQPVTISLEQLSFGLPAHAGGIGRVGHGVH